MSRQIELPARAPLAERCRVIGVLPDGARSLHPQALSQLQRADLVIGAERTLALLDGHCAAAAERRSLDGALGQVPGWIAEARQAGRRCVVLATGDPLCHGIAPFLAARLCLDAIEVLPNLSTVQLACARLGLAWQDLRIVSAHGPDAGEWCSGADPRHGLYAVQRAAARHDRLAVLTSPHNTPDRIARLLITEGLADDFQAAVAERLCSAEERVWAPLSVVQMAEGRYADPNVVLLWRWRARAEPVLFGQPDTSYAQRHPDKGLITKHEVRAVSLARLQLRRDSVVWDLGAGSGAVGLEAARLCERGHVYAIEKNADDVAIAQRNRVSMGVGNHSLVHGRAPDGLNDWPDPDAVFIGGSGGELAALIDRVLSRLRPQGRLVMNFVTIENLATATAALQSATARRPLHWDVVQLQAARSRPILQMHRLAAENPVWIVCAEAADAPALSTGAPDV